MKFQHQLSTALLAGAGLSLCGCGWHRSADVARPIVPARSHYEQAPDAENPGRAAGEPWWRAFQQPVLDELIARALDANLELRQFGARIEQANALLRQAGGRLFPSLDASGSYESRWAATDSDDFTSAKRTDSVNVGPLLNWELDVWGRLRAAKRARQFESQAAVDDWRGARLLLSASVAETYFEIIEQREQLQLLQEQIDINQTLLDLTKLRFGQGQSSIVDVLQQREQLGATRALVPGIETRLAQLEYALDVLVGQSPGGRARFGGLEMAAPPSLPAAGVPSDLLERRPDLEASRRFVRALDYRVAEALADRLPRFTIGGSLTAVGDPGINALIGSAFAAVAGPIFDGGVRKAEVDLRRAQVEEALASYSHTYLLAVQEVETALVRTRRQGQRVALLEEELENAQRLLGETRNRYSQGLTDYLPVLAAVVTEQNLERELLTSRRLWLSSRVTLHRALGGPMARSELPPSAGEVL